MHAIDDWEDLRRRLEPPDRRLYAFFHPALGDEPLIFVEVALTTAIPDAIQPLLARERAPLAPAAATTAVFYSISNAQRGLAGVSFGNFLIKQVVEDLRREWPRLQTFVTLSPVPGFAAWLARERADEASPLIDAEARRALALDRPSRLDRRRPARDEAVARALAAARRALFPARALRARAARSIRSRASTSATARGSSASTRCGDLSETGLKQSLGLMVNYLYDLDHIEENHEAYANRGEIAAAPRSAPARAAQTGAGAKSAPARGRLTSPARH